MLSPVSEQPAQEERFLLPWEAVHSKFTKDCYHRRSRQFLVFAGYMDPALWNHHNPTAEMVRVEREETERAMRAFIRESRKDPAKTKQQIFAFIDHLVRRMEETDREKRITSGRAKNLLKPLRLGLELNEVPLPWKKMLRIIPPTTRSKDGEYSLAELRSIVHASSSQLRVAELFVTSSGCRVGVLGRHDSSRLPKAHPQRYKRAGLIGRERRRQGTRSGEIGDSSVAAR